MTVPEILTIFSLGVALGAVLALLLRDRPAEPEVGWVVLKHEDGEEWLPVEPGQTLTIDSDEPEDDEAESWRFNGRGS